MATSMDRKRAAGMELSGPASAERQLGALGRVHFAYVMLPELLLFAPLRALWHHVLFRPWSPVARETGRPWYTTMIVAAIQQFMVHLSPLETRLLNNRKGLYDAMYAYHPDFRGYRDWVTWSDVKGVAGRWMAPPNTRREEDDAVLYFVGGGGFTCATTGLVQPFFLALSRLLNEQKGKQFSIFQLDYELAPEAAYPSQLIESVAGYHFLVNDYGIPPSRICIGGDSAGGNLAIATLLHLARPNPLVKIPAALGSTPPRPAAAFLVSPFVTFLYNVAARSKNEPFDVLTNAAAYSAGWDYVGAEQPPKRSFNPFSIFWRSTTKEPSVKMVSHPAWQTSEDPYANPEAVLQKGDRDWVKDAFPEGGRTMVTWGGREIFAEEIERFTSFLEDSGVAPRRLVKPSSIHDWPLMEYSVPGLWRTDAKGERASFDWGVKNVADLFEKLG